MSRYSKIRKCVEALALGSLIGLTACDSKRAERPLARVKGTDERIQDYRQSFLFDQTVDNLSKKLHQWSFSLVNSVDQQLSGEKQPILASSFDFVLPLLKEAQRGFLKQTPAGWKKEIQRSERLSPEKDVFLDKMEVAIQGDPKVASKENPWIVTAFGRHGKDPSGEIFRLSWQPSSLELKIESLRKEDKPFSCVFHFRKGYQLTGLSLEKVFCINAVLFRLENKDIHLSRLQYEAKKGFIGEGKVITGKTTSEKWTFPSTSIAEGASGASL